MHHNTTKTIHVPSHSACRFFALLHQALGRPQKLPSVRPPPPHPLILTSFAHPNSSLAYRLAFVIEVCTALFAGLVLLSKALHPWPFRARLRLTDFSRSVRSPVPTQFVLPRIPIKVQRVTFAGIRKLLRVTCQRIERDMHGSYGSYGSYLQRSTMVQYYVTSHQPTSFSSLDLALWSVGGVPCVGVFGRNVFGRNEGDRKDGGPVAFVHRPGRTEWFWRRAKPSRPESGLQVDSGTVSSWASTFSIYLGVYPDCQALS